MRISDWSSDVCSSDLDDSDRNKEIIVTGTRRNDLTAAQSPTPIDIISSDELLNQGSSDVTDILRQQVPALNVQRFTSNDGSVFTRPYSMRGLRSEEHTSELQSLMRTSYAVFCLKKNKIQLPSTLPR